MSSKKMNISFEYLLFGALVLQVAKETSAIKKHRVNHCHGNHIVLDCPPFVREGSGGAELSWQYVQNNNKTMTWTTVAQINSKEELVTSTNSTHLEGRLAIYRNGSLEISHLGKEDERLYRCQVLTKSSGKSRKFHFVEIKLTCNGGSEITTREVCTETDIVLDCKPAHQPHPSASVTWHQKDSHDNNTLSWSRIIDSKSTSVRSNGSLWIRGGRDEGDKIYRCEIVKEKHGKQTHLTVVKDIVCKREKRQADTSKHQVTVCAEDKVWLPCSALKQINISQVRQIKWRVLRTLGSKHWTELAHLKIRHQDKLNRTSLREENIDGVGLEPNGSLLVKNVSEVNGDFECIVKTRHENETKRSRLHVTVTSCQQRIDITPTSKVVAPEETRTVTQQPQGGQSNTPTPRETSRGFKTQKAQKSTITPHRSQSSMKIPQVAQSRAFDEQVTPQSIQMTKSRTQEAQPSTIVRHETGPFQNTTTRIVIGPSMVTTTSSWSVAKPAVSQVQTTVVTTVTTSITTAGAQNRHDEQTVCGGVFTSSSGGFQSPNYPSAYPANSYCKWTITVPQNFTAVHIKLDKMNLEYEEKCRNDHVIVYDELGNQVGSRHCGANEWPIIVHVHGRKAVVEFKSDHSVEKTGFKLMYKGLTISKK